MFVTRHKEIAQRVQKLRAFGVDRSFQERNIPGVYDVTELGLNYRMSELQAALGRSQLARFGENLSRRERNFRRLQEDLAGIPNIHILDSVDPQAKNSYYCLVLFLKGPLQGRRDEVVLRLKSVGVGTSVYYPRPVPHMQYYREKYGQSLGLFPNAARLSDSSLALPVGPHAADEEISYVGEKVRAVLEEDQHAH